MKLKIYSLFIIGILMFSPPAFGQKTVVVVEPDAGLEIGALNTAITTAADPGNTIFELKRNGLYILNGTIANAGYTLHIRGQEGAGSKPVLQPGVDELGASQKHFTVSGNLILEHLYLQGRDELGAINTQPINVAQPVSELLSMIAFWTIQPNRSSGQVLNSIKFILKIQY